MAYSADEQLTNPKQKPLLEEQAIEHAKAIDRANLLAAELSSVMSARDSHEARAKSLEATASLQTEEITSLQTTAADLSRQVQGLLRQIAVRDDPTLANVAMDGNGSTSGEVITDRLLEFKSIRSLQEQNQKLLRLTRGLMAKLDAREIKKASADGDDIDTGATLDEATETINKLHTQLLASQKKINEIARERDFFSKLLAKGEGLGWTEDGLNGSLGAGDSTHQRTISTLQAELEVVRTKAEADIASSREQARIKAEEAGVLETSKARAEAKITLLEGMVSNPYQ